VISSAEPPETPLQPGLSTARIRVHIMDLEQLGNDAAREGETGIAALARNLSRQLWALLSQQPATTSVVPPAPSTVPPRSGV
jgi:hypothetical protein